MSFTAEVKEELATVKPECSHCARATLAALVRIEGSLSIAGRGRRSLSISTDVPAASRLALGLIHELYQIKTDLTIRRNVLHNTPNYLINVPYQPGLEEMLEDLGILQGGSLTQGIAPHLVTKQCCAAAYLRGAFLGGGFVSNPASNFHFEINAEHIQVAEGLVELMALKDITARITQRRNNAIVYLKSGEAIFDFLVFTGAHTSALAVEDQRMIKSVSNTVNRATNAEMANQAKIGNSAAEQLYAMDAVVGRYGMNGLPHALQEVIILRYRHPDVSIKELGQLATPPLSKSAVYHRLRRIEEMASGIQGG